MTQTITPRPEEEIKADAKKLLKACLEVKTRHMIDKEGVVWTLGKHYGMVLHWRTGFGHWSERILDLTNFDVYAPYRPVTEAELKLIQEAKQKAYESESKSS